MFTSPTSVLNIHSAFPVDKAAVTTQHLCKLIGALSTGRLSGLEYALRLDIASALGASLSAVIVDSITTSGPNQTQVPSAQNQFYSNGGKKSMRLTFFSVAN